MLETRACLKRDKSAYYEKQGPLILVVESVAMVARKAKQQRVVVSRQSLAQFGNIVASKIVATLSDCQPSTKFGSNPHFHFVIRIATLPV